MPRLFVVIVSPSPCRASTTSTRSSDPRYPLVTAINCFATKKEQLPTNTLSLRTPSSGSERERSSQARISLSFSKSNHLHHTQLWPPVTATTTTRSATSAFGRTTLPCLASHSTKESCRNFRHHPFAPSSLPEGNETNCPEQISAGFRYLHVHLSVTAKFLYTMSKPYDQPPAYDSGPQHPQAAYQQPGQPFYGQQQQQQQQPYGNNYYYQSNPNMGYYQQQQQQGPPPGGYYQQQQQGYYGPPQQGGYYQQGYPPQGRYQDQGSSSGGCLQGILAGLACCCCLDLLF